MSGTGAETSVGPTWVSPWERAERRRALLQAAHRFAAKYGIGSLSLSNVAQEAGVAPATVYGHFTSKKELLAQLPPLEAVPADEAAPEQEREEPEEMLREQAGELDRLAKRLLIPKALLKGGTDSAIASLETRLGVIEKSFAETEKRGERAAKEIATRFDAVAADVEQLKQNVEQSETRQQWSLAELRLEIYNLAHPKPAEPIREAKPALPELPVEAPQPKAEPVQAELKPDGYLASARRAAKEAAAQQALHTRDKPGKHRRLRSWFVGALTMVAAAACAALYLRVTGTEHAGAATILRPIASPDARAVLIEGLRLLNGSGRPIDLSGGVRLIARAAADGDPVAQQYLGQLYRTGTGVVADMAKAVRWDEAAAEQGNLAAMSDLGKAYAGGWPEGRDFAKAAYWLSHAARLGDIDAAFDLGVLYERGAGVPQNTTNAFVWYSIAAKEGDTGAAARARILAGELDPGELAAGRASATSFAPEVPKIATNELPKT